MSGNDPLTFVIQRNGVIVTKRWLDYETKPEYVLIELRIIKSKSPLEDDISNLKLWAAVYKKMIALAFIILCMGETWCT